MKIQFKLFLLLFLGFTLISTTRVVAQHDDDNTHHKPTDSSPTFATYRTDGNYHQGDVVIRDYKAFGGSAGPFSSLTGHNNGLDPALDPDNWCYLPQGNCGSVIPGVIPLGGVVSGSATGIVIPAYGMYCVPVSGPITLSYLDGANVSNGPCTAGGAGIFPVQLSAIDYTFVVTISPKLPDDGSTLGVVLADPSDQGLENSCTISAGGSECQVQFDFLGADGVYINFPINKGDITTVGFQYTPGSENLASLTITHTHFSLLQQ